MDCREFKDTIENRGFPIIWGQLGESPKTAKGAEEDPAIEKGLAKFIGMMPRPGYGRGFRGWIWMMDAGCGFDHPIGNPTEDDMPNGEYPEDIVMDRLLTALGGIGMPKCGEE